MLDKIRVPVFSVGGWFDNFVESDLEAYERLRKNSGVRPHHDRPVAAQQGRANLEGVDFGPDANVPLREIQLQWFDQFLKGKDTPLLSQAPVRVFVMGANRWRDEREWPPPAHQQRFYLESRGHANTLTGDGTAGDARACAGQPRPRAADRFVFDPQNPVPTAGGAACCNPEGLSVGAERPARRRAAPRRAGVHHRRRCARIWR